MKDLICIIPICSFEDAKSRLSVILSDTERVNLLKSMLKDIITAVEKQVTEVIFVSRDRQVYEFAKELSVSYVTEENHEDNHLNNALCDAINSVRSNFDDVDILIIPGDIPMIKEEHILSVKSSNADMVISPSRGGGTNLLCFNSDYDFEPLFGDMSYFRHLEEAYKMNMSINVVESFYLSLDVNTSQDLGEIILHAIGTDTHEYLSNLNIIVKASHGQERLDVKRNDE